MIVRRATIDELRALGLRESWPTVCECGVPLDVHPPLPKPLDWSHGRPCAAESSTRVFSRAWRNRKA